MMPGKAPAIREANPAEEIDHLVQSFLENWLPQQGSLFYLKWLAFNYNNSN